MELCTALLQLHEMKREIKLRVTAVAGGSSPHGKPGGPGETSAKRTGLSALVMSDELCGAGRG